MFFCVRFSIATEDYQIAQHNIFIRDRHTQHDLIDKIFSYGIIITEVMSVLVKVCTVQTCGDWAVLFISIHNGSHINIF